MLKVINVIFHQNTRNISDEYKPKGGFIFWQNVKPLNVKTQIELKAGRKPQEQ